MKKFSKKILSLLCAMLIAVPAFCMVACGEDTPDPKPPVGGNNNGGTTEKIDYVEQLHLDMTSDTKKLEVEIRTLVDGDTTHFDPPVGDRAQFKGGYIKARYLAVNTPESTGKIEKWGKTASNYTNEKLKNAESIIVESDDNNWNFDTNDRYMLWVWYKPQGGAEYRNLNVELLQEGYGRGSKTEDTLYGEIAFKALMQAQDLKLVLWSNDKDPNYFGGEAEEMDLRYLRFHIDDYLQRPVRVEGVVTAKFGNSAYIEQYDEETDTYFGIAVYYHYDMGKLLDVLSVGHRVSVCGTVTEYNGTYQITDVSHNEAKPWLSTNTIWLDEEEGTMLDPVFRETTLAELNTNGERPVVYTFSEVNEDGEDVEVERTLQYGEAVMDTAVTLKNLTVKSMYSTKDNNGVLTGQISITCEDEDGNTIVLRTEPMKKADGKTNYTEADIGIGTVIASVKGIVDKYNGSYQLAVWDFGCFTFA